MPKVAIVQHPPVFLNLERSMEKACALIQEASAKGAELVVFPETWLTGYPVWLDESPKAGLWDYPPAKALFQLLVENSLALPGPHLERLQDAAARAGCHVVMGAHERRGGSLYNAMIFLGPKGGWRAHRKLVPTYTERLVWGRGDGSTLGTMETDHGPLGGLICWEHWMPLARAAMHARHEAIHVAQWPTVREMHQVASRHYAFEGQCFVLAAGCVLTRGDVLEGFRSVMPGDSEALELLEGIPGGNDSLLQRGGSAVIAPDGDYLAGPVFDEGGILYADLDMALITQGRMALDTDGHYSRPDVFKLEVNTRAMVNVDFRAGG